MTTVAVGVTECRSACSVVDKMSLCHQDEWNCNPATAHSVLTAGWRHGQPYVLPYEAWVLDRAVGHVGYDVSVVM